MQPASWWILQAVTLVVLTASAGLAFGSSGRVGRHTPYGGFLFTLALGYWFVATGTATYVAEVGVGAWRGPPGWGDAFTMAGWALLVFSFYLLLHQFPPPDEDRRRTWRTIGVPLAVGAVCGVAAWSWSHGRTGTGLAESAIRGGYLFLDGLLVSVFLLSIEALRRLRRASLGRLYIVLGVALVIKTLGDILFLVWPRDNPLGLLATATYPLAGLIGLGGFVAHHRAVAAGPERRVLADPGFTREQLVLRDVARRLRGVAGMFGEHLVLSAAQRALQAEGVPSRIEDGILLARAPPRAWRLALDEARARARDVLGQPAEEAFTHIQSAYAVPLAEEATP